MKRLLVVAAAVGIAFACAQQQERVRKASDASAEAQRTHTDAGVVASASPPAPAPAPTAKPAQAPAPALKEAERPAPTITQLPSGAGLLVLPLTTQAIVDIELRFRSGAVDDPPGKAGLTVLTARVMAEGGTQALDAKSLLNALFPLAADLGVRVDKEQTTFIARVHRDNLAKFLPIVTDVLLHPRWDPQEFKRLREAAVNDVEKRLRQGDDENLGKESLSELMYRDHPYGRLTLGHLSDLKSMTIADLQAHAARVFTADRLTIGVAGGYPPHLGEDVAQTLSALPPKSEPPPAVPQAHPHGPRFLLVEKNADSTAISMGMPWALSHKDPDWAALSIARDAMGEHRQFNGRLMQRLREMRGLNYGDYAYAEHFEQEGGDAATAQTGRPRRQQDFTVWLRPVRDDNRLFAVRAALYELSRSLKEEPFTAQEVEKGKGFLDGYILLFDQTDARKLGYALDDAFYGVSNFLGTWRASLRNVTVEQVNAAWRKWVDPSKLEIVMAGKDMASVRKIILSGEPTPIQYQRDATGKTPDKPAEQLAVDKAMASFPLGAHGDADVVMVPVDQLFE
ncbi:MAG: insulinase family protein [Deltaproteobacteria bacterium]|nr:MAG: insulinase family protein [Deltaproteobacteria bacterium]